MNKRTILEALSLPVCGALIVGAAACSSGASGAGGASQTASELSAPVLGTVGSFAVLGGSTVTNTGATTIAGDLGVSPGLAITGFPPGLVVGGATHAGDAVALQAQTDTTTAYDALAAQACSVDLSGKDLGGLTLTPGVYCFGSSAQLTGALILDAGGKSDAVFVFKTASTLTTASNASVQVINGGSDCGVFWQIGSSATLGTGTVFAGSVLALASITVTTGAKVSGRVLARTGAVTMDDNAISLPICAKPAADAAAPDAAPSSDAGAPDAAPLDGSGPPVDAAVPPVDAGASDAGTSDAGASDGGTGGST
jgi:type VI secretion system secreted protein VgrG